MNEHNSQDWTNSQLNSTGLSPQQTISVNPQKKAVVLDGIIKEIESERVRLLVWNIFSWILVLFALVINLLWILQITKVFDTDVSAKFSFFIPWISVPLFVISLILVVYVGLDMYAFGQEKKFHFSRIEDIDTERVPNFIINKYKNLSGLMIFYNWFAGFSYVIVTILLLYFFLFRNQKVINLGDLELSLRDNQPFPNYNWDIAWSFVYVGAVFIVQLVLFIYCSREKARLTAIFDLNKKMDYQEIRDYEYKIHILCFVLFLLPVLLFYLFYWVFRRIRGSTS